MAERIPPPLETVATADTAETAHPYRPIHPATHLAAKIIAYTSVPGALIASSEGVVDFDRGMEIGFGVVAAGIVVGFSTGVLRHMRDRFRT